MSEAYQMGLHRPGAHELETLRGSWLCLVSMGITLIILGLVAIGSSFIATLATMLMFGVLLLAGAGVQIFTAIWGRQWRGFFLHLLAGILYLVAGVFFLERPLEAAVGLTLLIAACLMVGGFLRIILSMVEHFHGWGWMLLSGLVSLFLGISIWRQWPLSGFWVIGLFIGIEMLLSGWSWLMLGLAVRSIPKTAL